MSDAIEKPNDVTKMFQDAMGSEFESDTDVSAEQTKEKAATQQEQVVEQAEEQKPAPKRDDKGRFAAEGDTQALEEQEQADEELVYEVADEETGRKQVFKGKSKDEVIEKLLKSQREAAKAIRDREKQIRDNKIRTIPKPGPRVGEEKKPLTPEEQVEISSLMVTDPAKAKKRLLEAELGVTPEEAQAAIGQAQANAFVRETPEFYPCTANANAIGEFLKEQGLAPVKQNFAYAYHQLLKEGALVTRESGEDQSEQEETDEQDQDRSEVEEVKPRIAVQTTPTKRKMVSSGISGKRSVRVAPKSAVPSVDEAENMSLDELRDRIVALHHAQKSSSR